MGVMGAEKSKAEILTGFTGWENDGEGAQGSGGEPPSLRTRLRRARRITPHFANLLRQGFEGQEAGVPPREKRRGEVEEETSKCVV